MGSVLAFPATDPTDVAIGHRLKTWREHRGVSIEALAEAIDLPPDTTRRAEAGRAHLDSSQINAATLRLSLPVWALLSDTRAY